MKYSVFFGRVIVQDVCRQFLTVKAAFGSRGSPSGICGGHSGTGIGFSLSPSIFLRHYHSTDVSCSLVRLCEGDDRWVS